MSLKASTAVTGARVASRRPTVAPRATVMSVVADASEERVRLHNLTPLKGSRPRKLRIGRGYGAGQGGSCGDGYVILGRDSHRSRARSRSICDLSQPVIRRRAVRGARRVLVAALFRRLTDERRSLSRANTVCAVKKLAQGRACAPASKAVKRRCIDASRSSRASPAAWAPVDRSL